MQNEMTSTLHAILKEKVQKNSTLKKDVKEAIVLIENCTESAAEFYAYIKGNAKAQLPFIKCLQEIPVKNKLFFLSLQILHKLIARNSISRKFIPYILEELEKKIDTDKEVQLKVLQLLQPLVQDPLLVRGPDLLKLFKIGTQLIEESKNIINTESAAKITLCHVIECIFERPGRLDLPEKEKAKEDCRGIIRASLECAKKSSVAGLEMVSACISGEESGNILNSTEKNEILEEVIGFLLKELEGSDGLIIRMTFSILLKMLTRILQQKERVITILLEITRIKMKSETEKIRDEFLYALPYKVITDSLRSSEELTEHFLKVPDGKIIDVNSISEIGPIDINNPGEIDGPTSLRLSKIFEITEKLDDPEILEIFMPYFTRILQQLECLTGTWPEPAVKKVKKSVMSVVNLSKENPELFNELISTLYIIAERHPKVFYNMSGEITFTHRFIIRKWMTFFSLSSCVQDTVPELNGWNNLVKNLKGVEPAVLKAALEGACNSLDIPHDRFLGLLLSLMHRAPDFPPETMAYIHRIFLAKSISENGGPAATGELITYFLNGYFGSISTELIHLIIFPELRRIFSEIKKQNQGTDLLFAKIMLQSISEGVRRIGETFGKAWTEIYSILIEAVEEEQLRKMSFEIVKIITDRMLKHLPSECLIKTQRLLCICCKLIAEDNISFQALFCIRDLTEYTQTEKIPDDIRVQILHAAFCILCSISYDRRDDVRDSAIVQVFETIYFCEKVNHLEWEPLINVFLKRFLSAAVYAKEKETHISTGEESSSDSLAESINETECLCNGAGACSIEMYTPETKQTKRTLESAKKILLGVSNLIFTYFSEMHECTGFYSLWLFIGRILTRFSSDQHMKSTVISALRLELLIDLPEKYSISLFRTVSDICSMYSKEDLSVETVTEILKQAYNKIPEESKKSETERFFTTVSYLLKNSTVINSKRFTYLEFEAIEALSIRSVQKIKHLKLHILLEWLSLPHVYHIRLSEAFLVCCIDQLEKELIAQSSAVSEITSESVKILLGYHQKKQLYALCWKRILVFLQRILYLERNIENNSHLTIISREILRLPDKEKKDRFQPDFYSYSLARINSTDAARIKEEEQEIKEHLVFLEALSEPLTRVKLLEVYSVIMELWELAAQKKLHSVYLAATKTLCHIFSLKKELKTQAAAWILKLLVKYNIEIRIERTAYSFFYRQAISHVLQEMLDKRMKLPRSPEFLSELTLCVSSTSPEISAKAIKLLRISLLREK